ncbi:MAG: hypothetical protein HY360_07220 [Verrucomicrobia bacterium]|nr:hypothetical protein [Verrucomicrobiota bacterium]
MSYRTLEVEIDHGKVVAKQCDELPDTGRGLLTILEPDRPPPTGGAPLEALEALQEHLRLDEKQAADWMATVRNARR